MSKKYTEFLTKKNHIRISQTVKIFVEDGKFLQL